VERYPTPANGDGRALLVYQEDSLFPWMTALQNAAFGLEMQGVPKQAREDMASELLGRMGVSGREHSFPHQLSLIDDLIARLLREQGQKRQPLQQAWINLQFMLPILQRLFGRAEAVWFG
jgi:hypothetical protein